MHSVLSRANAIFSFTLTVLASLTFCCFLTNATKEFAASVTIQASKPLVKHLPDYSAAKSKNDLGFVDFDLEADLTPLFDWNTKQLFLYLTAEYKTKNNALNQVVLWDKIILRGENSVVDLKSAHSKYYFWDDGDGLRGNGNVTLTLSWNVIPNAGRLPLVPGIGQHRFQFPDEYSAGKLS